MLLRLSPYHHHPELDPGLVISVILEAKRRRKRESEGTDHLIV